MVVCAVLLLGACSTGREGGPAPVEQRPDYTPTTKPITPAKPAEKKGGATTSTAAQGLMNKAEQAAENGDYEQALALLERALRIDPDNGELYLALASTYTRKGDTAMAKATAQRGMLYCRGAVQCDALRRYNP